MITYYIYKIHFLCGFPTGRYYIGKHIHYGTLDTDNSIKEAADATESKWQSIQRVCSGQRKSTNNYKWKYAD